MTVQQSFSLNTYMTIGNLGATPYEKTITRLCISVSARCTCRGDMTYMMMISLKLLVSFAEYSLFYRALLQRRPIILRSLLIEATP